MVRWAAVEAVTRPGALPRSKGSARLAERRGKSIARAAAVRKLLTLVYYGLRDGEICSSHPARGGVRRLDLRSTRARPRNGPHRTGAADHLTEPAP